MSLRRLGGARGIATVIVAVPLLLVRQGADRALDMLLGGEQRYDYDFHERTVSR